MPRAAPSVGSVPPPTSSRRTKDWPVDSALMRCKQEKENDCRVKENSEGRWGLSSGLLFSKHVQKGQAQGSFLSGDSALICCNKNRTEYT